MLPFACAIHGFPFFSCLHFVSVKLTNKGCHLSLVILMQAFTCAMAQSLCWCFNSVSCHLETGVHMLLYARGQLLDFDAAKFFQYKLCIVCASLIYMQVDTRGRRHTPRHCLSWPSYLWALLGRQLEPMAPSSY